MLEYHSDKEIKQMPTEAGYCKFVLIGEKWHVKGPTKDLQGKGPFTFQTTKGPVTFEKEKLKFVKRYPAKHRMSGRQVNPYVCKYDLYEILRET